MSKKELAPEIGEPDVPKIRIGKDGTKRYYFLGMLHRNPEAGPAIEEPGEESIGDCYSRGILLDEKWYKGKLYQCLEDVSAFIAEEKGTTITPPTVVGGLGGGDAIPRKINPGVAPAKVEVHYMPIQDNKPKHKDRFNKLSDRVRGSSMKSLQDLYDKLSGGD